MLTALRNVNDAVNNLIPGFRPTQGRWVLDKKPHDPGSVNL